jgi:YVTN family beta-propeller protein
MLAIPRPVLATVLIAASALSACSHDSGPSGGSGGLTVRDEARLLVGPAGAGAWILPNGRRIEPAGTMVHVDSMPLGVVLSGDGRTLFVTSDGQDARLSVSAIDTASGTVVSSIEQRDGLYLGLALAPDGRTLYAGGGGAERVVVLDWDGATLTESRSFAAGEFPAGLALSKDGRTLYALTQSTNGLTAFDTASGTRLGSIDTDGNPYAVALAPDGGEAYVSSEKSGTVGVFDVRDPSAMRQVATIPVQKNPEALALGRDGDRLYVANSDEDSISIVDVRKRKVASTLDLRSINAQGYGTGPNALALSPDGRRLYVAQAADNRVAVVDLASATVIGAIPTAWYPTAVAVGADGKRLYVACAKGIGTGPSDVGTNELVNQATIQLVDVPTDAELAVAATRIDDLNSRTARLYDVDESRFQNPIPLARGGPTPIEHVFLVVRENKTYDALLGDFPGGNGKPENCLYCGDATPNLHALVERFASGDNYYSNAETSDQGHQLLTSSPSRTPTSRRCASPRTGPSRSRLESLREPGGVAEEAVPLPGAARQGHPVSHLRRGGGHVDRPAHLRHRATSTPARSIRRSSGSTLQGHRQDRGPHRRVGARRLPPLVYMLLPDDHTLGCEPPVPHAALDGRRQRPRDRASSSTGSVTASTGRPRWRSSSRTIRRRASITSTRTARSSSRCRRMRSAPTSPA